MKTAYVTRAGASDTKSSLLSSVAAPIILGIPLVAC